jgi:hypothetical protein
MKGHTNNPNGRPVGSPNKTTTEIKSLITDFVGRNINTLQTDFEALDPKDRLAFFEKLLGYAIPKQREAIADEVLDSEVVELTGLPDEVIKQVREIVKSKEPIVQTIIMGYDEDRRRKNSYNRPEDQFEYINRN